MNLVTLKNLLLKKKNEGWGSNLVPGKEASIRVHSCTHGQKRYKFDTKKGA